MTDEIPVDSTGKKMNEARLAMHGRILHCFLGGNPTDCPLCKIRLLSLEERFAWLESKTDGELEVILCYHSKCLNRKTNPKPSK